MSAWLRKPEQVPCLFGLGLEPDEKDGSLMVRAARQVGRRCLLCLRTPSGLLAWVMRRGRGSVAAW